MNQNLKSTIELMMLLTKSTATYVHRRIMDSEARKAYELTIKSCLSFMEHELMLLSPEHVTYNSFILKSKIKELSESAERTYEKTLFKSNHESIKYHKLACMQVAEIVNNLEIRFITGGTDFKPRNVPYKEIFTYENKSIF